MLICGLNCRWEWSHLSGRISVQNIKLIIGREGLKGKLGHGVEAGGDAFLGNPLLKDPVSSSAVETFAAISV